MIKDDSYLVLQAPESNAAIKWKVDLPHATIPLHIALLLKHGATKVQVENIKRSALPKSFDAAAYGRHFKVLLWAEEFQMECVLHVFVLRTPLTVHRQERP